MAKMNRKARKLMRNIRLVAVLERAEQEAAVNNCFGTVCPEVETMLVKADAAAPIAGDMERYANSCSWEQEKDAIKAAKAAKQAEKKAAAEAVLKAAMKSAEYNDALLAVKNQAKANVGSADTVLVLRPSGVWAKRPVKSAKESARWMRLLLDLKEAEAGFTKKVDLVTNVEEEKKAEFMAWKKSLEPVWFFSSADKAYEVARRRIANANAIEQLGHPAKVSAAVFSDEFLAVEDILGEDFDTLAEQGCKAMYEGLIRWSNAIDQLKDELADDREIVNTLTENGDADDYAIVRETFRPIVKKLKAQIAELEAERRLISRAIKLAKEAASPAEKALIKARGQVASKKIKKSKVKEGRVIVPTAKPDIKGFKLMGFEADFIMPKIIRDMKKELVKRAQKWAELKAKPAGEVSGDDITNARKAVISKFIELYNTANKLANEGACFEARADKCQVNNARQSQLSDVIEVEYGKETDKMISLEHSMANFLPTVVKAALDDDPLKAQKNIDELEISLLTILTENGLNLTFKTKKGERVQHYKFWNANNSALKVGKCYALSDGAYELAKDVAQAGMSDEEFERRVKTNGSDMLKYWSYATTPGCVLEYNGEPVTINDVLVIDSIELERTFSNVLEFVETETGVKETLKDKAVVNRTAYDGQLFFMVPIPSQQIRGGFCFKGYGVNCAYDDGTNMVDRIAQREGIEIPEYIRDIDGVMRRWRDYKVICTKDCWKWAGWKITYAEYRERMNKLTEKHPAANLLYTARIADATEESRRRMTRQSTGQLFFDKVGQIDELIQKSVNKVNKLRTHEGVIRKFAGLDKAEEDRNAFEHLIEVAPELLDHDLMKRFIKDQFDRDVAEGAVRPEVDGIYPYIAEDPVAFFKIVIFGMSPAQAGLGYLNKDEVNIPEATEGQEMYLVRYPNNYLCGMIGRNHNDDIYECVGNTMILSIDGYWLIRADGDVDGDEMCAVFNQVVIDLMKQTITKLNPPLIVFPHQKMAKEFIIGHKARAAALARAMVIANKFGPAVGQNSNMATKFMTKAAEARVEVGHAMMRGDKAAEKKARWKMNAALNNAIIAHIAAIIAIDLAKTGEMPSWLESRLGEISKYAGKRMPWNQRFCKDSKEHPWFSAEWDEATNEESKCVVDRIARTFIGKVDAYNYVAPTDEEHKGFDHKSILCGTEGLYTQGSKGKLNGRYISLLDSRNYTKQNDEDDNEIRLIETLHSESKDDVVSFAEIFRFFWRNRASLVYKFQSNGDDNISNAEAVNEYYDVVRNIMIDFGTYCGNAKFASLSREAQRKSNVWHAIDMAFGKNTIGHKQLAKAAEYRKYAEKCTSDAEREKAEMAAKELEEQAMSAKASFAVFTVKVFAYDLYVMTCEKKGITQKWVKPDLQDEDENYPDDDVLNVIDPDMMGYCA